jgi:hypothetical protein
MLLLGTGIGAAAPLARIGSAIALTNAARMPPTSSLRRRPSRDA